MNQKKKKKKIQKKRIFSRPTLTVIFIDIEGLIKDICVFFPVLCKQNGVACKRNAPDCKEKFYTGIGDFNLVVEKTKHSE